VPGPIQYGSLSKAKNNFFVNKKIKFMEAFRFLPLDTLQYIGPVLRHQFAQNNINNFGQLVQRLQRLRWNEPFQQARARNTQLLKQCLANVRPEECVGINRVNGNLYSVRQWNKYGWNAIIEWLHQYSRLDPRLIPARQPMRRPNAIEYPNRCGGHPLP
jgi:hypothetical protein